MAAADISRQIDDLKFQVDKSIRYHHRIQGFYDTVNRLFLFVIIATGGGAVLIGKDEALVVPSAAVLSSVVAALLLVWAPANRARNHQWLHFKFSDLMIAIQTGEHTKENYLHWDADRRQIEKDEPAVFYALEADCDNQARRAWDRTDEMVKMRWWHRWFMYLIRFDHQSFPSENQATNSA